jgi:hypothetical protein
VIAIPFSYVLALNNSVTIGNVGSITTIGVTLYWDLECTNEISSIDWGITDAGSSVNNTVYIKNIGNKAATLSMNTSDWQPPEAFEDISLDWGYGDQSLDPNAVLEVTLTLSISPSISNITNFSFNIIFIASS